MIRFVAFMEGKIFEEEMVTNMQSMTSFDSFVKEELLREDK